MKLKLLSILALVPLAAGCDRARESVFGQPGRPVVRISTWGGAGEDNEYDRLVKKLYADFEAKETVDVRLESIPGEYVQKMLLNFVAGTQPDVMILDASSAAVFIENGLLQDLTPYIDKDLQFRLEDYFPNVVGIAKRGEKIHAIPGDFTPMVMYYNKDLFDAAGVPYPKTGWTFDDFIATAKKLTDTRKEQYGFVFPNWMPSWIMWFWNNGGDVLSPDGSKAAGYLDSDANVETAKFLRDMIRVHKVAPTLSEAASTGVDLFANGQAAMAISGHWSLVGYKNAPKGPDGKPKIDWKRLGVCELPHNTPKAHTVMYEAGFAIPKGAKSPEEAWKLVKLWTSYAHQAKYNASGIAVCARKDVAAERAADPIEAEFLKIVPQARPPWGSKVTGYEAVERIGKSMMDSLLNTDVDPKLALRRAAERIDREFAKR